MEPLFECKINPLLAYKASTDPDTMYLHEVMHESDSAEFLKAMQKKVEAQMQNGNYSIMQQDKIPLDSTVLPAVWPMRWK
jgi:hypothetical protein